MVFFATPPVHGSLAHYVAVHEAFAHPVPDSMSDDAAALIEPLSVGVWANRKAGTGVGSRVLVTGAGPIGVLCALAARVAGASWVGIADVHPARLKAAAAFDFDDVIDAREGVDYADFKPDVLLECSGAPPVVTAGIKALQPLGTAVLVGMGPSEEQNLPVSTIQNRELTVTGTFRYAHTYPDAIAMVASGRVDLDALVGARLPLAESEARPEDGPHRPVRAQDGRARPGVVTRAGGTPPRCCCRRRRRRTRRSSSRDSAAAARAARCRRRRNAARRRGRRPRPPGRRR